MMYRYRVLIALLMVIFSTQILYLSIIDPRVDEIIFQAEQSGEVLPRNIFILLKDFEQKTCLMLFLWGAYICYDNHKKINKTAFIYKVDFLREFDDGKNDTLEGIIHKIEDLPDDIKESSVVRVLLTSIRRFQITKDVDSAASCIESSLEILSIRNSNDLAIVRYISWAIPSIGFLGTVRGIGMAMSQAGIAVQGDIGPMTESLGVAFNSTFISLIISIFLMMLLSYLQKSQDEDLLRVQEYCEKNLLKRLSTGSFTNAG